VTELKRCTQPGGFASTILKESAPMLKRFSNIIGFDDAPFPAAHTGAVRVVGTVYAKARLDGILIGDVQRDGTDAARKLARMVAQSKFAPGVQLLMLQGIALAGFNVVDVFDLNARLQLPVLVVARRRPDMAAIRSALMKLRGGRRKWALIERLGPMEAIENVYVQRVGLTIEQAGAALRQCTFTGHIPEPLRVAHLIAGAITRGQSSGRV
jgi:hypothetical protein